MWTITNLANKVDNANFIGNIAEHLINSYSKYNNTITYITSSKLNYLISLEPISSDSKNPNSIQVVLYNTKEKKTISESLLYNTLLMPNNTKPLEELIKLYIQVAYTNYNKKALLGSRLKITYKQ